MKKIFIFLSIISITYIANAQTVYLQNECVNPECYYLSEKNALVVTGWNCDTYNNVYYTIYADSTMQEPLQYGGKYIVSNDENILDHLVGNDTVQACYKALKELYIFNEWIEKED